MFRIARMAAASTQYEARKYLDGAVDMFGSVIPGDASGPNWADWANVIAAAIVAAATVYGLSQWKREHRAKRAMELAEKVLTLAYECLDAIDHMRHGWQPAHEVQQVERRSDENDSDFQRRRYYEIVFLRYKEHANKFAELMALRFRAEVLFSRKHREAMEEVQVLANRVQDSAQSAHRLRVQFERLNETDRLGERGAELWAAYEAHEAIMCTLKPKDKDPFFPTLKAARENLERLFKHVAAHGDPS